MIEEIIENIVERCGFERKELFGSLVRKCIKLSKESNISTYAVHENIAFKLDTLFKGFSPFNNELGKGNKYECGVHVLSIFCEELGIEIEPEECFILYHLRDLGKFRVRESKIHDELKLLWQKHKKFALEDREFSGALKNLMRLKFIDYRKRNLHVNKIVILSYRD